MSDPVNLNTARKARMRAADKAQAGVNRVKFGRTKSEKAADQAGMAKAARQLDGARREP